MAKSSVNAVSSDNLEIPLIDFSAFLSGDPDTRQRTAQEILSGFQNAGFIYLRNHPIAKSAVQRTFELSAEFFKRPLEQKDALSWTTPEANRGYSGQGREKTSNSFDINEIAQEREEAGADLKESFEIGREGQEGMPNHWPDRFDADGKTFKDHMTQFFEQCKKMHAQVLQAIAVGLGIEGTWFDSYCDGGDNTLRLLHYPEVKAEVFRQNKNQVRAGAHSDYGSITLVGHLCFSDFQLLTCAALPGYARWPASHVSQWTFH
jgi:isopenicillin N synthase-like dioxygenase